MLIIKIDMEMYQVLGLHSHFSHRNVFKKYTIPKYSLKTCIKNIVSHVFHVLYALC